MIAHVVEHPDCHGKAEESDKQIKQQQYQLRHPKHRVYRPHHIERMPSDSSLSPCPLSVSTPMIKSTRCRSEKCRRHGGVAQCLHSQHGIFIVFHDGLHPCRPRNPVDRLYRVGRIISDLFGGGRCDMRRQATHLPGNWQSRWKMILVACEHPWSCQIQNLIG